MSQLSARSLAIVDAYRDSSMPTMRDVAAEFGVTVQRVQQVIARHTKRTGERFPRRQRFKLRTPWSCSDCGVTRNLCPSAFRSKRCGSCHYARNDEENESFVKRRLSGESWCSIARSIGVKANASHSVAQRVYFYLKREGRFDEVMTIFNGRVPKYINRDCGDRVVVMESELKLED